MSLENIDPRDGDHLESDTNLNGNNGADQRSVSRPAGIFLKAKNKFVAYREKGKSAEYRKERRERITIVLLVVTSGLILWQICEMVKVYDPIDRQARAANASAKIADDTAKRQLRAHVLYDGVTITQLKNTAAVSIRFKNSGATPAYETTYWWNVKAFTPTEAGKLEFFDTEKASIDIGAGSFLDTDEREIPLADIEEARRNNKIIYVWGLVKYRDVFQRCQYASFALRSGTKIDFSKWILRGFTNGSTIVSDSPDEHCKSAKNPDSIPAIFVPPK
jgi:hypothetical protein